MSFLRPQFEPATLTPTIDIDVCDDCYGEDIELDGLTYFPKTQDESGNEFNNRDEFSWSQCECCGSTLGGSRYTMSAVDPDSQPVQGYKWRLSAPGFLDCTDWSFAESLHEAISDCLGMHGDGFDENDYRDIASHLDGFDEFFKGYLLGLAFTGRHYENEDGEPDSLFGEPGCDIADCVDVEYDIWQHLEESDRVDILADCVGFFIQASAVMGDDNCGDSWTDEDYNSLGSDFHLTRNGHGAGFWDGGWPEIGDKLTSLAEPFGTLEIERYGDNEGLNVVN